jgi:transcriptional regulator with XRE-family HTH domain
MGRRKMRRPPDAVLFTADQRQRFKVRLLELGLTQHVVAMKLGYPAGTLSSYINGAAPLPSALLRRLEAILKVPGGALAARNAERVATRKAG